MDYERYHELLNIQRKIRHYRAQGMYNTMKQCISRQKQLLNGAPTQREEDRIISRKAYLFSFMKCPYNTSDIKTAEHGLLHKKYPTVVRSIITISEPNTVPEYTRPASYQGLGKLMKNNK